MSNGVRPTKRCLDDLDLGFPPLDVPLEGLNHELIAKAQRLPEEHASGGAERVRSLSDRVWFKVKVGEYRGAAGAVVAPIHEPSAHWWLVAAGRRRSDSRTSDFYARLEEECKRSAKQLADGPQAVSSEHLLPQALDIRRLEHERIALGVVALQAAVREAIRRSAHCGRPVSTSAGRQRLTAWVATREGDTYLAIIAAGFLDPNIIAVVLDSVPGMGRDDWMAEPAEVLGIAPAAGQIVFSGMLPPQSLAGLLDDSAGKPR